MNDVGFMNIISGYHRSIFQDFESYFRTEFDLVEDVIKLVLDEYNSCFLTYELQTAIYTFKDLSEAVLIFFQPEYPGPSNVIDIEFNDITTKTKLVVKNGIIAIRLDEKSFFNTVLGFTPGWDYKHYIKYNIQKIVNLSNTNKIHLKCDVIDGSVVNGIGESILFSLNRCNYTILIL